MKHVPVLLNQTLEGLALRPGMKVIDATLGDAGHAEQILLQIGEKGSLLGIDADPESILRAKQYLYNFGKQAIFVRENFINLFELAKENGFLPADAVLFDLGWSTPQFDERGRGFSFQKEDEPLDMRYECNGITAAELLEKLDAEELSEIFRKYGEEKLARQIAQKIVIKRKESAISKVRDLVNIILQVYQEKLRSKKTVPWVGKLHPATKVFQALRIAVNDELSVLTKVLPQAIDVLRSGGRLAVISFHSGEDRVVKRYFQKEEGKKVRLITHKPITAKADELESNPKSRSAKLRIVEKI